MGSNPPPAFTFGFGVNGMLTVTQIILVFYGHKISERFKLQFLWIFAGVVLFIVPFVATGLKEKGFGLVFVLLLMFGVTNGILQGSVFGAAGTLPSEYMGVVMTGNGLSAVLAGAIKTLLLILEVDVNTQAYIQFSVAFAYFTLCGILYSSAINSKVMKYYRAKSMGNKSEE